MGGSRRRRRWQRGGTGEAEINQLQTEINNETDEGKKRVMNGILFMMREYYKQFDKTQGNLNMALDAAKFAFNQLKNSIRDNNQLQMLHEMMGKIAILQPVLRANFITLNNNVQA
jgi:hypothetical protein